MKALYAGSFDCYTNGHHHIVKQASRVFDELHVVVATNVNKKRMFDAEDMADVIRQALKEENIANCVVGVYCGIIADYCKDNQIDFFVRGLRNSMDYSYEENMAEVNKLVNPNMESIYFRSDNVAISSSMVKEMLSFQHDVSKYVPRAVLEFLQKV